MKTVAEIVSLMQENKMMKLLSGLQEDIPLTQQGLDSLDMVMLLYEVEGKFGVRIPQEQTGQLRTLQDIANFVNVNG